MTSRTSGKALEVQVAPCDLFYLHEAALKIADLARSVSLPPEVDPAVVSRLMTVQQSVEDGLAVARFKQAHALVRHLLFVQQRKLPLLSTSFAYTSGYPNQILTLPNQCVATMAIPWPWDVNLTQALTGEYQSRSTALSGAIGTVRLFFSTRGVDRNLTAGAVDDSASTVRRKSSVVDGAHSAAGPGSENARGPNSELPSRGNGSSSNRPIHRLVVTITGFQAR